MSNAGHGQNVQNTGYLSLKHTINGLIVIAIMTSVLGLSIFSGNAYKVNAVSDSARWDEVGIPAQGITGGRVLAEGSDVRQMAASPDGTLYAYVEGLDYTLYKSEDSGITWSTAGKVTDSMVGIAVSPGNPNNVYYATSSMIYRSVDAGNTFLPSPPAPGDVGTGNIEITSIDITRTTADIIAVGTRDRDGSEYGGVYILDETVSSYVWANSEIGSYDVYSLAFSPNYHLDGQLIAVITDETDTYVSIKPGSAGWGSLIGTARLSRDNAFPHSPVSPLVSAAITFPANYSNDFSSERCVFYTATNTGIDNGDVYRIKCVPSPGLSIATDLNAGLFDGFDNVDISTLAGSGLYPALNLYASVSDSTRVYFSTDSGITWSESRKPPTGDYVTGVLLSPDFAGSQIAYAATGGTDSAFSVSRDGGYTWNQLSLIDNRVSMIVDMAPSPDYDRDNTLYMITFGNGHSLWRSQTGGITWERILSSTHEGVDTLTRVGLPAQSWYSQPTVFLTGESLGRPAIWESLDNGQSYLVRHTRNPATGTDLPVDTWAIVDETTLFIGSYDGAESRLYKTINSGFFFFEGVPVGNQPLNSIVLSPDYKTDGHIIAGNNNGWVFWSDDGGLSFQPLPREISSPPLSGQITVAFDPDYRNNRTIYAASNTPDSGIYRFVTGKSSGWEAIDNTLPPGARINQLVISDNGVLYTVNSQSGGGMERCLNPSSLTYPPFDTATQGLSSGATLYGLWRSGHRIWSIDTTNIKLMTYHDTLTTPVTQVSPDNEGAGIGNLTNNTITDISLDWETLEGATGYQWQCDSDIGLSSVPDGFEGTTTSSSVTLPPMEPSTTYYWRVRASSPVLGPWSEKWAFTTTLGTVAISFQLESPGAGATDVPIKPIFQWTGIVGADAYELVLCENPDFSNPVIVRENDHALPSNAWQCETNLEYATAYFWKVRAINGSTRSPWSSVGSFTTESEPVDASGVVAEVTTSSYNEMMEPGETQLPVAVPNPQAAPQNGQPPYAAQNTSTPEWVAYLIGSQVVLVAIALIIILILVSRKRRT